MGSRWCVYVCVCRYVFVVKKSEVYWYFCRGHGMLFSVCSYYERIVGIYVSVIVRYGREEL